jgi:hypothetical protein
MIAYAESHIDAAQSIVTRVENAILFPLMTFMLSVALLMFLWGMYEYVRDAENDGSRGKGRSHMLYGIIGMLVMLCAMAILEIAAGTFGVTVPS